MSLFFTRPVEPEVRSVDSVPWDVGGSISSMSDHSMRLIPVYAATSLIADSIATLPLHAYRTTAVGRDRIPSPALITAPQVAGGRIAWVTQAITSLLLHGNAYGVVVATDKGSGWPTKIAWLDPTRVQVKENGGLPRYEYNGTPLDPLTTVHIPGYVLPGSIVGLSPISAFRLQIEKGYKAQKFGGSYFDRGVAPTGVLRNINATLTHADSDIAKARFRAAVANRDIFVTGKDWEWSQLTVSAADQIFLDAIEASATEVAAIFRVPPEEIGGKTGYSRTYANLTQDMRKFSQRTVAPWTARLEEGITSQLPRGQYAKFNLDAGVRSELKERMEAHAIALQIGLETLDEARALEDKAPLTAEQVADWKDLYRAGTPAPAPTEGASE